MSMHCSHLSGKYEKPFIFSVESDEAIEYACNGAEFRKYYSSLLMAASTSMQIRSASGTTAELHFEFPEIASEASMGPLYMIGGADKCAEIHQSITAKAGGIELMRVAFIPAGSANPYAAGMDRKVRFETMAGLKTDLALVPQLQDKYDFSSLQNESRFWIVPVAILDDPETCSNPKNDPDQVISDESTFPAIDESKWHRGGFDVAIAQKLLDGNYNVFFFTGGNQTRYISAMLNPDGSDGPLLAAIRWLNKHKGAVIAGTSAGGAGMSQTMITGGGSAAAWLQGHVTECLSDEINSPEVFPSTGENDHRLVMGTGLGFLPLHMVSDTHFFNRGRQGRLLKATQVIAENIGQKAVGIGAGENTAVLIEGNHISVVGEQGAFVAILKNAGVFETFVIGPGDSIELKGSPATEITAECTLTEPKLMSDKLAAYLTETDIFGRHTWGRFIARNLANLKTDMLFGLTYSGNQPESADWYPFSNDQPAELLVVKLKKTPQTQFSKRPVTMHFFGSRDRDFPEIIVEDNELDFYSHVVAEVQNCLVVNAPTFRDAENVRLSGNVADPDDFDEYKRYHVAALMIPSADQMDVHAFFLDYAYADENDNRSYDSSEPDSPGDYLILETTPAEEAEISVGGSTLKTDRNGMAQMALTHWSGKFELTTKSGKSLSFNAAAMEGKPCLVFSEKSY